MGSDGVFDNLFDEDIKQCIRANHSNVDRIADCVATYAEFLSYQKNHVSPFTDSALKHNLPKDENLGGKPDDITVIIAQIKLRAD